MNQRSEFRKVLFTERMDIEIKLLAQLGCWGDPTVDEQWGALETNVCDWFAFCE